MASYSKRINSQHILVCRTDNIGDLVLTLPMLKRLRELNPGVRITMLCRAYAADVVRLCPHVDEVVAVEDIQHDLAGYMKRAAVDTILLAQPDKHLARAAFLAGVRNRIGNSRQKLYLMLFCNRPVRFSKRTTELHEAQINFEFLRRFGDHRIPSLEEIASWQEFRLPPDAEVDGLLAGPAFNLIFHPRSNGHGREWPIEHFAELARRLDDGSVRIWITGSTDEGKWLQQHAGQLLDQPHVHNVCGRFSLRQLALFIARADGLIASGTGPLHLSGALGQRTIGLFPPTRPMHPGRWAALGPRSVNLCVDGNGCAGCASGAARTCDCMQAITPQQVLDVVNRWRREQALR